MLSVCDDRADVEVKITTTRANREREIDVDKRAYIYFLLLGVFFTSTTVRPVIDDARSDEEGIGLR